MLTEKELHELYNKVVEVVDNCLDYYTWYCAGIGEWWNDTGVTFTCHGHCTKGDGLDWDETWGIDYEGSINANGTTYNSFEEFKNNW